MKLKCLAIAESALAELDAESEKLTRLQSLAETNRSTIQKLESDLADIRANQDGHSQKSRSVALVNTTSMLALERSDAQTLANQIDFQCDQVMSHHQRATHCLSEVWSALLKKRRDSVEASLRASFDIAQLHAPIETIVSASLAVIEVSELQNVLFQFRYVASERELVVQDAESLRDRSAALTQMAHDEPGLELNFVDPGVKQVVTKPKPAPSTMSAALIFA